jgi:hypothetical protein
MEQLLDFHQYQYIYRYFLINKFIMENAVKFWREAPLWVLCSGAPEGRFPPFPPFSPSRNSRLQTLWSTLNWINGRVPRPLLASIAGCGTS